MPFLIDGHNLIPKIPGLHLGIIDDEIRLVELVQNFCRDNRKDAEIYFDNAPPGFSGRHKTGRVTSHFVRQGQTADNAIAQRLVKLGNSARNWTVVSSDRAVQAFAREARAQVIASESFASQLTRPAQTTKNPSAADESPTDNEVEEWLAIFSGKKPKPKLDK
jgi:uncharacterized protein